MLPSDRSDKVRIVIRRSKILHDTLYLLRNGLDVLKHIRVTFVNEPAVDQGGPLREYFRLLLTSVVTNNILFSGPDSARTPNHNMAELEKMTFYYVGVIIALSLLHGGPAPQCFSSAVADYIIYGVKKVNATIDDVPDHTIKQSLQKV